MQIVGSGNELLDVTFEAAYCVSVFDPVLTGGFGDILGDAPVLTGSISLIDDETMFGGSFSNLNPDVSADSIDNMINYILNQDFGSQGFTDAEIQGAIWGLTDDLVFVADGAGDVADADAILADAIANGADFEAGAGDIVGIFIDPSDATEDAGHSQPFIVGVTIDECIC